MKSDIATISMASSTPLATCQLFDPKLNLVRDWGRFDCGHLFGTDNSGPSIGCCLPKCNTNCRKVEKVICHGVTSRCKECATKTGFICHEGLHTLRVGAAEVKVVSLSWIPSVASCAFSSEMEVRENPNENWDIESI